MPDEKDLELINNCTLIPLKAEDVFVYKVQLCDNDIDRVGDKMTPEFLEAVSEKIKGVVGLKDHDWRAENQLSRLYDAEVAEDPTTLTKLGEPRKYVLGKAYTLSKYKDYIEKINSGLLKEVSISFESEGDTCSICGEHTEKDYSGRACCCHGHVAGEVYDGKICYNNITKLKDVLEWSLVPVPCQKGAGVSKKNYGGGIMRKVEYLIKSFMTSKAYEGADAEDKAALESVLEAEDGAELSAEDIEHLVEENRELKHKVHELEAQLAEANGAVNRDRVALAIDKAFEGSGLIVPEIKSLLMKELPIDSFTYEDGVCKGLDEAMASLKAAYKGCFKEAEAVDTKEVDTVEKAAPEEEVVKKQVKKQGITFGVTQKSYENKEVAPKKKPGIYFN